MLISTKYSEWGQREALNPANSLIIHAGLVLIEILKAWHFGPKIVKSVLITSMLIQIQSLRVV